MQTKRGLMLFSVLLVMYAMLVTSVQAAQTKTKEKQANPNVKITAKQAEKIALAKYPGKIVEKTKLENENGVWQYAVMVKSGKTVREVMVNAKTGKIDSVEVTTPKTEKKEAAEEKKETKNKAGAKKK